MEINPNAKKVLNRLTENGYEAYLVGGCVRDFVMGKIPNDYDITTSALPEEIKTVFERTADTGIKHGTVTVILEREPFEVTTFRSESEYEKNRKPKKVEFVKNLEEDLKRRDFTMNAMCLNEKGEIIDLFGGIEDIKNKTIRCVGEASVRFEEDALRMLRLVRFACKTGFKVEENTLKAVKEKAHLIKNISGERIKNETDGALLGSFPENLSLLFETKLSEYIFGRCNFELIKKAPDDLNLKWALFLSDNENPISVLEKLKFDNKSKREILNLLENKDKKLCEDEYFLKCFAYENKIADFNKFLDFKCTLDESFTSFKDEFYNLEIPFVKDLEIDGNALIEMGFEKERIGKTLEKLLYKVFENKNYNNKEELTKLAEEIKCCGN